MNAQEFEIGFYKAMGEWVAGGKAGPDPRGRIEHRPEPAWVWLVDCDYPLMQEAGGEYRWRSVPKPTVEMFWREGGEVKSALLVAPETTEPVEGTPWFYENLPGIILKTSWVKDRNMLALGKVFLTSEDAQAMADVQRKQRLGGVA